MPPPRIVSHLGFMGFTVIELLVAVLIIGILAAIVLPQYFKAVEKSKIQHVIINLKAAGESVQLYLLANNDAYPTSWTQLDVLPENCKIIPQNNRYCEAVDYFYYINPNSPFINAYKKRTSTDAYNNSMSQLPFSYNFKDDPRTGMKKGEFSCGTRINTSFEKICKIAVSSANYRIFTDPQNILYIW
jgi:type II secretion system protein G